MDLNTLNAISPVDGRYRKQCEELSAYFSEEALIRYRLEVEVEYFIALCELPLPELKKADASKFEQLKQIYVSFNTAYAQEIKSIEKITNHDVKAVEYFLKKSWMRRGLNQLRSLCTSVLPLRTLITLLSRWLLKMQLKKRICH